MPLKMMDAIMDVKQPKQNRSSTALGAALRCAAHAALRCDRLAKTLDLSHNRIGSLAFNLGKMKALRLLDVSHNAIDALPPTMNGLAKLTSLAVDHNRLTTLPAELGAITTLRRLTLDNNRFDLKPRVLEELRPPLQVIDLGNNALAEMRASGAEDSGSVCERIVRAAAEGLELLERDEPFPAAAPLRVAAELYARELELERPVPGAPHVTHLHHFHLGAAHISRAQRHAQKIEARVGACCCCCCLFVLVAVGFVDAPVQRTAARCVVCG